MDFLNKFTKTYIVDWLYGWPVLLLLSVLALQLTQDWWWSIKGKASNHATTWPVGKPLNFTLFFLTFFYRQYRAFSRSSYGKPRNMSSIKIVDLCFVHPIFLSFGFWYFGHFSCVIFFLVFFLSCPSCLAKCKQRLRNIFIFS